MTTATGAYATLSAAKTRLSITDTTDDAMLQGFCDQVNQFLETFTGRILAPVPWVNTTLSAQATSGASTFTVTSPTSIVAGMRLVVGDMNAATQEAVSVASVNGSTVTITGTLGATYASGKTVATAYLFDGIDILEGGRLVPIWRGIVSLTQLRLGFFTGDTLKVIPTTDWFLRPQAHEREPGWPYTELWMTDLPSTSNPVPMFLSHGERPGHPGYFNTIELTGQLGWPAIPDDITAIALSLVVGLYRARGAGGGDSFTIGSDGSRTFERLLSYTDRQTLLRYQYKPAVLI